jgi:hypothetical protein
MASLWAVVRFSPCTSGSPTCNRTRTRACPEQLLLQADDDVVGIKVNGVCKLTGAGRYRQNCSWQGTSSARIDHA